MKSDTPTPRTDKVTNKQYETIQRKLDALENHSRQLERELNECAGKLAEANSLIYDIAHYPIHSEPMGGAMDIQDRAFNFLAKHPIITH